MSSRLVSLLGSVPLKKPGPSADFEKVKEEGGSLPKRDTNLELIPFVDLDPRFTRLRPGLALRLLSKGLFYIRAMGVEGFRKEKTETKRILLLLFASNPQHPSPFASLALVMYSTLILLF